MSSHPHFADIIFRTLIPNLHFLLNIGDPEDSEDKEPEPARLKLKWKAKKDDGTNGGYDEKVLKDIFEKVCRLVPYFLFLFNVCATKLWGFF